MNYRNVTMGMLLVVSRLSILAATMVLGLRFVGPEKLLSYAFVISMVSAFLLFLLFGLYVQQPNKSYLVSWVTLEVIVLVVLGVAAPVRSIMDSARTPQWSAIIVVVVYTVFSAFAFQWFGCHLQLPRIGLNNNNQNRVNTLLSLFGMWLFMIGSAGSVSLLNYELSQRIFWHVLGLWSILGLGVYFIVGPLNGNIDLYSFFIQCFLVGTTVIWFVVTQEILFLETFEFLGNWLWSSTAFIITCVLWATVKLYNLTPSIRALGDWLVNKLIGP